MKYEIDGVPNDELITRYFIRDKDILVRYLNGTTDILEHESIDDLEKIMREQAHLFILEEKDVRKLCFSEYALYLLFLIYYESIIEMTIRGLTGSSNSYSACAALGMWLIGGHIYEYVAFEKGIVPGKVRDELTTIKKYKKFFKYEKEILEYLKTHEHDFSGRINDLDTINYKGMKELIKLSKRKK